MAESNWSSKVIIPVVAALALAIVAGMSDGIKIWFSNLISSKVEYNYECTVLNAGIGVSKALIIVDKTDSLWTDTKGKFFLTKLKKGKHSYSVIFRNADYPFNVLITGESLLTKETQELSAGLIKETKPIEPVETIIKKKIAPTIAVDPEKNLKTVNKEPDNNATVKPPTIESEKHVPEINLAASMNAGQILQKLQLRVYKDSKDLLNGEQIAYHYYLQGEDQYLDRVVQASYRRNDETFNEYKRNQVLVSDVRSNKFDIKGYQWGFVSTTYVSITLDDGTHTDLILKSIAYDN